MDLVKAMAPVRFGHDTGEQASSSRAPAPAQTSSLVSVARKVGYFGAAFVVSRWAGKRMMAWGGDPL